MPLDHDAQTLLDMVRAYQLVFIRMGPPDNEDTAFILNRFDPLFPSNSDELDREPVIARPAGGLVRHHRQPAIPQGDHQVEQAVLVEVTVSR